MHVFCANKRHLTLLGSGRNFLDQSQTVEEKFLSLDTISSATVRRVIYNLTSGKMKGRKKCWKIKMKKRKNVKLMKTSRKSERTLNSCMRHGDDHGME